MFYGVLLHYRLKQSPYERRNIMKIAGIILIVLEAVSIAGAIANGSLPEIIGNAEIIKLIGFLLPGIIGAILLAVSAKKKKKKSSK